MLGWERFWDIPCFLIEEIALAHTEQQKAIANRDALPVAYAIETINLLAHQLYGPKEESYEMAPERYLPYPPTQEKPKTGQGLSPTRDTLKVFFAEMAVGGLPGWVVAHLSSLIPGWKAKNNERFR